MVLFLSFLLNHLGSARKAWFGKARQRCGRTRLGFFSQKGMNMFLISVVEYDESSDCDFPFVQSECLGVELEESQISRAMEVITKHLYFYPDYWFIVLITAPDVVFYNDSGQVSSAGYISFDMLLIRAAKSCAEYLEKYHSYAARVGKQKADRYYPKDEVKRAEEYPDWFEEQDL